MGHGAVPGLEMAEEPHAVPDARGVRALLRGLVPAVGGVQGLAVREPSRTAASAAGVVQSEPGVRPLALYAGLLHPRLVEPAAGAAGLRDLDLPGRALRPLPRLVEELPRIHLPRVRDAAANPGARLGAARDRDVQGR